VEIWDVDERTLRYWIGFNRAKGIGPTRLRALMQHFGDIETAWKASARALQAAGLDQRSLHSLLAVRDSCNLDAELQAIERAGAWVVTLDDAAYPAPLRNIPDAPPVLYIKGTLEEADAQAIAVIGTRRATSYGKAMTQELVEPLAERGITIVSGLARGIDAVAHQTALDAGGRTIAVMATGIDIIYPSEHRQLAESIMAHGALISELPLGEPPESIHFAPRNRIVSGLSMGIVIVEAGERSGALMTADLALEQGREVFAVPGNALSPASKGTNTLIQAGARVATSAEDVIAELGLDLALRPQKGNRVSVEADATRKKLATDKQSQHAAKRVEPVEGDEHSENIVAKAANETEALILKHLSHDPQYIDDIAYRSGLPVQQVGSALTILEIKGLVHQVGVKHYVLGKPG
jgi:DNA processing protein